MKYRPLGRTGIQVSSLCLGTMVFGGDRVAEDDAIPVILRAIESGINFIDTADCYLRGLSEEIVGKAVRQYGNRDRLVIATKVHNRMGGDVNDYGNSRKHILDGVEASLRRLQIDYIDLYQIHRPQPEIPIDETLAALDLLVRSGKVRHIGCSSFAAWQVMESLWVSKELRLPRFISEQPPYHLLDRRIERELVPMAQTYGLAIIPWSPLASGFLTGKYKRGMPVPEGARLQEGRRRMGLFSDESFDVVEMLEQMAGEKGCSVSQLALAWVADQPGITAPIIGPKSIEQLEDNLKAIDVEVTDADRARIDKVAPPGDAVSYYYQADWGPHPHRW